MYVVKKRESKFFFEIRLQTYLVFRGTGRFVNWTFSKTVFLIYNGAKFCPRPRRIDVIGSGESAVIC